MPSSSPTSEKAYVELRVGEQLDPKEKQVINLDQDVQVCGYFLWMVSGLLKR